jgi:hypothetical protein
VTESRPFLGDPSAGSARLRPRGCLTRWERSPWVGSIAPMRSGLFVAIFDALADPALVARLSVEAEDAGWDGVVLWDHVCWREPVLEVADAWVTLAAIAATQTIRLGPMVTPLARRRPVKVARRPRPWIGWAAAACRSGVGLGSDRSGNELSITGEELETAGGQGCSTRPWRS